MQRIQVIDQNYDIVIGNKQDETIKEYLKKHKDKKILIVTDKNVEAIYQDKIADIMQGYNYELYSFVPGEESKTLTTYEQIMQKLLEGAFTRQDLIIAFGGGIVGDVTGFVASSYLRGIQFISIPTTLLAMVDSSVGGKNGVNLNNYKNQIGSFYFPEHVHIDTEFLKTLQLRDIKNGLAEILKYAVLADENIIKEINKPITEIDWECLIKRSLEIKVDYVKDDVKDKGKRQFLNLGHTIAHAIESKSGYEITHGEAVGIGMVYMARAAYKQGKTKELLYKELITILKQHGMPINYDLDIDETIEIIKHDKKKRGNNITIVVPKAIEDVVLEKITMDDLARWISLGQEDDN